MRCGRCGNDNSEANRFCGMCGAPLVAKSESGAQPAGQGSAAVPAGSVTAPPRASVHAPPVAAPTVPSQAPAQSVTRPVEGAVAERRLGPIVAPKTGPSPGPVITGHSFLGLNTPPADHSDRGRDALQPSSRNLDYLLEDEEEPKRGWGKLILIVVALGLASGFGYLHFTQGGFNWLKASDKKPAAAADPAKGGVDSGSATGTATTPESAASQAGAGSAAAPVSSGAGASPPDSALQQTTTPQTTTPQTTAPQTVPPQSTPSQSDTQTSPQAAAPQTGAGNSNAPADSATPSASSDSDKQAQPAEAPPQPKARAAKPAAAKPAAAKPAAAKPGDVVSEAERYIYGRGGRQDCDHGLRRLKLAADQLNPKAMISLGALYSTGTCTPRDLPTAYRWFALALHKQPDNQALQDDLQKLWGQMTQPERQLAIKLSQ